MDNQKYIVMTFLAAGVVLGFAVHGLALPFLAMLEVGDIQLLGIVQITTLVGLFTGIATFLVLNRHPVAFGFTDEAITELRKVSWPGKDETVRSTTVVVVFTFLIAATLAGYDFVWARITKVFLFTEG